MYFNKAILRVILSYRTITHCENDSWFVKTQLTQETPVGFLSIPTQLEYCRSTPHCLPSVKCPQRTQNAVVCKKD